MDKAMIWLTILGMGVISFLLRASFILFSNRLRLSPLLKRSLRFVPAAVLAAIVTPALFYTPSGLFYPYNLRMVAAIIAGMVAVSSKNLLLTLLVGLISLWLMQWLVGVTDCGCFQAPT